MNVLCTFDLGWEKNVATKTTNHPKPSETTQNHLKPSTTIHLKISAATEPTRNKLETTRTGPKTRRYYQNYP